MPPDCAAQTPSDRPRLFQQVSVPSSGGQRCVRRKGSPPRGARATSTARERALAQQSREQDRSRPRSIPAKLRSVPRRDHGRRGLSPPAPRERHAVRAKPCDRSPVSDRGRQRPARPSRNARPLHETPTHRSFHFPPARSGRGTAHRAKRLGAWTANGHGSQSIACTANSVQRSPGTVLLPTMARGWTDIQTGPYCRPAADPQGVKARNNEPAVIYTSGLVQRERTAILLACADPSPSPCGSHDASHRPWRCC